MEKESNFILNGEYHCIRDVCNDLYEMEKRVSNFIY